MDYGEIKALTNIARPTISVITNIGTAHIGKLGSRQNILKAKLEILEGMNKSGTLVINNDNDLLYQWNLKNNEYKVATFGIENRSDINAIDIELQEYSSTYIAQLKTKEQIKVKVPVGGKHFVYNSLCAIAVGQLLEIPIQDILKGIEEFTLTKRRMDIQKNANNITIINDSYNANYDSMKAGIEYLANTKAKRKIAVLGDMLELGEYSKQLHQKVGEEIVKNKIDILVTVGEEAKNIAKKAHELGMSKNIYTYNTIEEAIKALKEILLSDDIVLVKASNGMKFDKIVEQIQ